MTAPGRLTHKEHTEYVPSNLKMPSVSNHSAKAIRASAPGADHAGGKNWSLQDVTLRPIKEDEILVQMIATGICHTDLLVTSVPKEHGASRGITYPMVAGHEG